MAWKVSIGGTKGKTTILTVLEYCLLNILEDSDVLSISSTEGVYHNRILIKQPDPSDYLNTCDVDGNQLKYDYLISEAVSAELRFGTYEGHDPNFAVYTGIERNEHSEIHKTFEDYLKTKKMLYDLLDSKAVAIVNGDDPHSGYMVKNTKAIKITYGFNENVDYRIELKAMDEFRMTFSITRDDEEVEFTANIPGQFNAMNITAAFIILSRLGISQESIKTAISAFCGAPGRFQRVFLKNNLTIVDYAHTPKSLANALELVRAIYPRKKVVTVFGCGGTKSREKRPLMGKVASSLSDFVILTNDNPRSEWPMEIAKEISLGIETSNFEIILDRKRAIRRAIGEFKEAVILVAGKGNEKQITDANRIEIVQCKKCGYKMRRRSARPTPKLVSYSDVGYIYSYAKRNHLVKGTKFCDFIYTKIEDILMKVVILHYSCKFEEDLADNKIYLVMRNLKLQLDLDFYTLLGNLDSRKSLKQIFAELKMDILAKQLLYINYLDKLNLMGAVFTKN